MQIKSIYSIIDCFRCRYINSKNNSDVVIYKTLIMKYAIENHIDPDIGIKRYSNNGRIVDADDEYYKYLRKEKHKPVISNR